MGRGGVYEPNTFAFLNGGALRKLDKKNSVIAPDLEGFLTIGIHGAHSDGKAERDAVLSISENVKLGQFEFYFCRTPCLRAFFNTYVDELEGRLGRDVSASASSSGRAKSVRRSTRR